ncbi:hypothetical protein GCM10025876_38150 [Demequina litorisediminis]|uniref:Uncharacterized protein n=1 Tax=Demequina litorisediminis TaxID=1849022 RepID=A0ABQ6IJN4_9MICO|nr:hypothetical protein GCM10025876_38150 [Demequina litorisediminis]
MRAEDSAETAGACRIVMRAPPPRGDLDLQAREAQVLLREAGHRVVRARVEGGVDRHVERFELGPQNVHGHLLERPRLRSGTQAKIWAVVVGHAVDVHHHACGVPQVAEVTGEFVVPLVPGLPFGARASDDHRRHVCHLAGEHGERTRVKIRLLEATCAVVLGGVGRGEDYGTATVRQHGGIGASRLRAGGAKGVVEALASGWESHRHQESRTSLLQPSQGGACIGAGIKPIAAVCSTL